MLGGQRKRPLAKGRVERQHRDIRELAYRDRKGLSPGRVLTASADRPCNLQQPSMLPCWIASLSTMNNGFRPDT